MSLILEALRKSEAERRRGAPPQLLDPAVAPLPPPTPRPEARRALHRAVPGVLAAAALLLAGTWGYRTLVGTGDGHSAAMEGERAAPVAAQAAPAALPADPATPAVAAAVDPRYAGPTLDRTGAAAPAVDRTAATGAPLPARQAAAPAERRPDVGPQSPGDGGQPASIAAGPARPVDMRSAGATAQPGIAAPAPSPAATEPRPAVPARPVPPAVAAQPAPVAAAPAAAPRTAGPQRLADLAPADRGALPPLRMSMHLWSPAPAERFVILDGQRMAEGDRIGEAVVDEITAEGAVLAWQGRRLLVPVR